jgi:hypothetical protein
MIDYKVNDLRYDFSKACKERGYDDKSMLIASLEFAAQNLLKTFKGVPEGADITDDKYRFLYYEIKKLICGINREGN